MRRIKAYEARQARVIAYTSNPAIDESLLETLFVSVVRKPASPDAVLAVVQRAARS